MLRCDSKRPTAIETYEYITGYSRSDRAVAVTRLPIRSPLIELPCTTDVESPLRTPMLPFSEYFEAMEDIETLLGISKVFRVCLEITISEETC